jgi:hypothetical protein
MAMSKPSQITHLVLVLPFMWRIACLISSPLTPSEKCMCASDTYILRGAEMLSTDREPSELMETCLRKNLGYFKALI